MRFSDLQLAQPLLDALATEGYDTPTPIQAQAIPPALTGADVLGCAQTGTGKTAAFALPMLHRLMQKNPGNGPRVVRALVLAPTRELAVQIGEGVAAYGRHSGLRHTVVYGGVGFGNQFQALRRGVDIVVATPGRLLDLLNQRALSLSRVEVLVLDEADRMLDMGFIHDIRRVVAMVPAQRQTLFFSATMPPAIRELADGLLRNPVAVSVAPVAATADLVSQQLYYVNHDQKKSLLIHLLDNPEVASALVFTRTKHGADKLVKALDAVGIDAQAIHGNKSQSNRQSALNAFKRGEIRVLVATDIAARGIDVDRLSHVVNYDIPNQAETYVHRIGRTGRAGSTGLAISFCGADERSYLKDIRQLIRREIPVVEDHPYVPAAPEGRADRSQSTEGARPAARGGRNFRRGGPRRSR